jgi:hypothetical protein
LLGRGELATDRKRRIGDRERSLIADSVRETPGGDLV